MKSITLNKYGCRVVQTLLKNVPLEMVHELVHALCGFVVEASSHRHATHVVHCLAQLFNSTVYECVVAVVCKRRARICTNHFLQSIFFRFAKKKICMRSLKTNLAAALYNIFLRILQRKSQREYTTIVRFNFNNAYSNSSDFVPQILNDLVALLLLNAERFASNEFANYVVQYLIQHTPFKRQRDYIIDRVVT